jgi:hypothetical protein
MYRRAFCVSLDGAACSLVEAALTGAGLTVEHTAAVPPDVTGATVVVVDSAVRRAAGHALRLLAAPVIVIGDDVDDDGLIALMDEAPVSHLVEDPRDRDLGITSEKLASGDLFGLEKYVAPASPVGQRVVTCDLDKRRAMDEVGAWAESAGARRAVLHRIANVVDELLMNALHDGHAVVRWAADERTLALSVSDARGALRQCDVIDHVRRAKHERGRPQPPSDGGAGIGLYLVLANVAALVVNVERGRRTEVVCLFDRGARPARVRSLHVFDCRATG